MILLSLLNSDSSVALESVFKMHCPIVQMSRYALWQTIPDSLHKYQNIIMCVTVFLKHVFNSADNVITWYAVSKCSIYYRKHTHTHTHTTLSTPFLSASRSLHICAAFALLLSNVRRLDTCLGNVFAVPCFSLQDMNKKKTVL